MKTKNRKILKTTILLLTTLFMGVAFAAEPTAEEQWREVSKKLEFGFGQKLNKEVLNTSMFSRRMPNKRYTIEYAREGSPSNRVLFKVRYVDYQAQHIQQAVATQKIAPQKSFKIDAGQIVATGEFDRKNEVIWLIVNGTKMTDQAYIARLVAASKS